MIELVTKYKKDWSMFTLASLLDKSNFRLHLFVHKEDWNRQEVDWILTNFQNVKIYAVLGVNWHITLIVRQYSKYMY